MLKLRRPTLPTLEKFLQRQSAAPFSYSAVGASRTEPPAGYIVDHNRALLGQGQEVFERGKQALRDWKMFDLGWCRSYPPAAPLQVGTVVAVVVRHFGFWSLNASRLVYVVEEESAESLRFGFAYGTLADHSESGEERFVVEWNRGDDSVWYDLLAFSRPAHWLVKLAYPLARQLQRRFAHDSKAAMVRATLPLPSTSQERHDAN